MVSADGTTTVTESPAGGKGGENLTNSSSAADTTKPVPPVSGKFKSRLDPNDTNVTGSESDSTKKAGASESHVAGAKASSESEISEGKLLGK